MTTTLNASTAGAGGFIASGDNSGVLALQTAGTTAVTIDTSQNVGIGVTPSAWGSNNRALDLYGIGSVSSFSNGSGGYELDVGTNAYNSSGGWKYKISSYAVSLYQQATGQHIWYNAPSGTAGNAISFTQAMTLDSSGNLLVGTTSLTNKRIASSVSTTSDVAIYAESTNASYAQAVYRSTTSSSASTSWSHFIGQSSGSTNNIFIYGNGNITNTNNSYGAISDMKLKENIVDATPKLEKLCQIRVVNYNLKSDIGYERHKQIGVIAQELQQIFPAMIEETNDKDVEGNDLGTTTKSVKYSVFVPMLIKSIQELKAINDQQAETINALTARVVALEGQ